MTRTLSAAVAIMAALAAPRWCAAQENQEAKTPVQDIPALFQQLDANSDGQLTESEVGEEHRRLFKRLLRKADKDGDGKLSRVEFTAGLKEERPQPPVDEPNRGGQYAQFLQTGGEETLFRALDADGDGTISAEELAAAATALKKLDKDGDGRLTRRELAQAGPQPGGPRPGGNGPLGVEPLLARWKQMDKDGDGKLSGDELPPGLKARFDRVDANGDGFADQDELKAAAEIMVRQLRNPQGGKPPQRPRPDAPKMP